MVTRPVHLGSIYKECQHAYKLLSEFVQIQMEEDHLLTAINFQGDFQWAATWQDVEDRKSVV